MKKKHEMIKLSHIKLETTFRKSEKDISLELSIQRRGLIQPLSVEKVDKNNYILVDGYRRYFALDFLNIKEVECFVEESSTEEERIIKRLETELHRKRRTAYQLEKMINRLLENKLYDVKTIASLCNVKEVTIRKYIRGSDVKPEWLIRGEQNNAGRHPFTVIHHMNLSEENKDYIAYKYADREINSKTVDVLNKAINEKEFEFIPEEYVKDCLDKIIEYESKKQDTVKNIIAEYSLERRFIKSSHSSLVILSTAMIKTLKRIFQNNNFLDYLSDAQKNSFIKYLNEITLILNPPLKWSNFPNADQDNEDDEDYKH